MSVGNGNFQIACRKCSDKNDFFGILANIDEAACTGQFRAEFADVEVAFTVGLRQAEKGQIEAAAIIEILYIAGYFRLARGWA